MILGITAPQTRKAPRRRSTAVLWFGCRFWPVSLCQTWTNREVCRNWLRGQDLNRGLQVMSLTDTLRSICNHFKNSN